MGKLHVLKFRCYVSRYLWYTQEMLLLWAFMPFWTTLACFARAVVNKECFSPGINWDHS